MPLFLQLLKESFKIFQRNIVQILMVAIVISLLSAFLQSSLVTAMAKARQNLPQPSQEALTGTGSGIVINTDGESRTIEEDINQRGDRAVQDLRQEQILEIFFVLLPRIIFTFIAGVILSFLALAFYLVVSLEIEHSDAIELKLRHVPRLLVPLIGLYIWVFLRSFTWVPVIGILTSIYYFPRFAMSTVILATERRGIIESSQESLKRSRGQWWVIFSNAVAMAIIVGAAVYVLSIFAEILGAFTYTIIGILFFKTLLDHLAIALVTIFTTRLALTVMNRKATVA